MAKKFIYEEHFSFTELKKRGWNDHLVELLLPAPVERRNYYGTICRYYPKVDVFEMEKTDEFQSEVAVKEARKARREAATNRRLTMIREAFENLAETMIIDTPNRMERILVDHMHMSFVGTLQMPSFDATNQESTVKHMEETLKQLSNVVVSRDKDCIFTLKKTRWLASMFFKNKAKNSKQLFLQFQEIYPEILLKCAQAELKVLYDRVPDENADEFLMMLDFPSGQLISKSVYQLYLMYYIPFTIKQDLTALIKVEPKDEYPAARMMERKFFIHVGPTNSGKTYQSLRRLAKAKTGTYLGPLRLLALEVQEQMLNEGVKCSLLTGEEENIVEGQTHISSTVEKVNLDEHFDVAVIDECQMIQDEERGFAWTRAILGVQADEIHCCVAQEGLDVVKALITDCGDTYEIESTRRFTDLVFQKKPVYNLRDLEPGDAIIAFSKKEVLRWAEALRLSGKKASIIYGKLPYPARKLQIQRFLDGETQYIVSTDAIGMGLNLPIRRILFSSAKKFDGKEVRYLLDEEVRQIAGRAGRKGLYEQGYVSTIDLNAYEYQEYELSLLRDKYYHEINQIDHAYLGFTNLVLRVQHDTLDVLKVWAQMPTKSSLYQKTNIDRYIEIISMVRSCRFGFSREVELKCANVLFDESQEALVELFLDYCHSLSKEEALEAPEKKNMNSTDGLELYCRKLDLYYSFSKNFGYPVDLDWLHEEKLAAAVKIHKLLVQGVYVDDHGCVQNVHKKKKKKKQGYRNSPPAQRR